MLFGSNKGSCDGDTCRQSDGQLPQTVTLHNLLPWHLVHRKIIFEIP